MNNRLLLPRRIAILIDGGFFIKRFNALYNRDRKMTGSQVADMMYTKFVIMTCCTAFFIMIVNRWTNE